MSTIPEPATYRRAPAEYQRLFRAVGGWGRINGTLYFWRDHGAIRIPLDATHCPHCHTSDCLHLEAVRLVASLERQPQGQPQEEAA